jgi:hypothetical protein
MLGDELERLVVKLSSPFSQKSVSSHVYIWFIFLLIFDLHLLLDLPRNVKGES